MWSFALKALAVLVLRYKEPGAREFRVPFNLRFGRTELPLGLGLITVILFALCLINLFTKQVATLSGVAFTIIFFAVFTVSERVTQTLRACRSMRKSPIAMRSGAESFAAEARRNAARRRASNSSILKLGRCRRLRPLLSNGEYTTAAATGGRSFSVMIPSCLLRTVRTLPAITSTHSSRKRG
jgi:hypothetical protein